jgi:uncharacterized protein (DUF58 family)
MAPPGGASPLAAPSGAVPVAAPVEAAPVPLTWHVGTKVVAEGLLAGLALLAAAVTGDVALIAFATPLAIAAVLGLTRRRPDAPVIEVNVEPLVTGPSEPVDISVAVVSTAISTCRISLVLPAGVESEDTTSWTVLLRPGEPQTLCCTVRAKRAGRFWLGTMLVRLTDVSATMIGRGTGGVPVVLESRPHRLALSALVRPERVRATSGDRVARLAADGIEFADVREQQAGALERRINWRATARHGRTCVNVHHPERSTDVVLLADTFSGAVLPQVVAVAVSLAETYLRRHDRVGLVSFGGVLDWVEPGSGPAHLERVRMALLSSEAHFSYAWKTADVIPRRLFPAGCLVLSVSALGDRRFISTLASLRSRGLDLAIIEVEPPSTDEATAVASVARRIVVMERDEVRRQFFGLGVPVATVEGPDGIGAGLAEIAAFRRAVRGRSAAAAGPLR